MKRVLVTYATLSGSTAEVAQAIGSQLESQGFEAIVKPMQAIESLDGYHAVVAGAPMVLGWHRGARRFLKRHSAALAKLPYALFITAMSLTDAGTESVDGVPVFIDEKLPETVEDMGNLTTRQRYATVTNYTAPILRVAKPARPLSIAFFGGQLLYGRLKWWAVIIALLLVRGKVGDKRNWDAISRWTGELFKLFSQQ